MAVSNTPHFSLLNRWPVVMREDIWRFNQIAGEGVHVAPGYPNNVYVQPERDFIAAALNEAVVRSVPFFGFYPRPVYVEETIPLATGTRWDWQTLETSYGYLHQFGRRAVTLIASDVPLTAVDGDGDDVKDTMTATVTTAVPPEEIQLFFCVADGAPSAAHEQWRIEPVGVKANGDGTVTIRGHRALFAHPLNVWADPYTSALYWTKERGDTSITDDFVSQVDVYRVYNNSTNAAVLIADPADSIAEVEVLPSVRDSYEGYFRLRKLTLEPVKPRQVRISYLAGLPLVNGQMETALESALCRYANVLMPQSPVLSEKGLSMWQEDLKNLGELGLLTQGDNERPPEFGIWLGAYNLWQVIRALRNERKARIVRGRRA